MSHCLFRFILFVFFFVDLNMLFFPQPKNVFSHYFLNMFSDPFSLLFSFLNSWNAKIGSQETPGVTGKFGLGVQNEAGQRLTKFCEENALVIANTLFKQHKRRLMDITRWSIPKSDWLYSLQTKMEKLYAASKNKTGIWLWLKSWTTLSNLDLNRRK